jgi:hypothetical protein
MSSSRGWRRILVLAAVTTIVGWPITKALDWTGYFVQANLSNKSGHTDVSSPGNTDLDYKGVSLAGYTDWGYKDVSSPGYTDWGYKNVSSPGYTDWGYKDVSPSLRRE